MSDVDAQHLHKRAHLVLNCGLIDLSYLAEKRCWKRIHQIIIRLSVDVANGERQLVCHSVRCVIKDIDRRAHV